MKQTRSQLQSTLRTLPGVAAVLLVALATGACIDLTTPNPIDAFPIEDVTFGPSLGIDLDEFEESPNGLWIRYDAPGSPPTADVGTRVEIQLTGWLPSGEKVIETELDEPASFLLGEADMAPGVQVGVTGMSVGGQRTLLIPPYLGFGNTGEEGIPGESWLVVEVVLVSVDGNDGAPG